MKKRYLAVILITAILISAISFFASVNAETPSFQSLGSITNCTVDESRKQINIHGSIKHSVLIGNRDSKIAVYRFDPWTDIVSAISSAEPCAVTDMSISFDFDLPCSTVLQKTSLYAVALINPEGTVSLITAPTYPDANTSDTSDSGFKAILTTDHASALPTIPGSAIVDVYLDKLNNGNNSGYIYNADGDLFYFDKATVNGLDKIIRSYTAAGTNVYIRFLISPYVTYLPFCSDAVTWATNKCVVIDNEDSLKAVYAYTSFLISRYSGGDYGRVDGVILGRGADMPILNNYASLVSEDYNTVYARSLAVIGIAAAAASEKNEISLLVPISDTLTPYGRVNAEEFLYSVADYIETFSNLTFTVFCESKHNPYGITDELFASDIDPETTEEYTVEIETELTESHETDVVTEPVSSDETTSPSITEVTATEVTTTEEETISPIPEESDTAQAESTVTESSEAVINVPETTEDELLKPNTNASGFFCTDNIESFVQMFEKIKKSHSSVNDGFAWCWYPDANTAESSLSACYSFNYMKLAATGADFYAIGFENELVERFQSVANLFKYIDTSSNIRETAYARNVFEVDTWKELINNWSDGCGVYAVLHENELQFNIADFSGEVLYLDYSSGKGAVDWYCGHNCKDMELLSVDNSGYLKVSAYVDGNGFAPSEIGYVLNRPEPLLVGDALTFDIKCGENDGSIYEVAIYINHDDGTLISRCVVLGGINCALSADVSQYDSTTLVHSIRISIKRITGDEPFDFNLYQVKINDSDDSNAILAQKLEDVRNYLRTDTGAYSESGKVGAFVAVVLLTGVGAASLLLAYGNDRKKNDSSKDD